MNKRIAIIENNKVINIIIGNDNYLNLLIQKNKQAIECPETVKIGDNYINNEFSSAIPNLNIKEIYTNKVSKAISESTKMMTEIAADNILLGITQAGKTKLIADTLKDVIRYCQSGSLYEAINELDRITITADMAPFLTEEKKLEMKDKIVSIIQSL